MSELKHAEIICHMAKYGYDSVEWREYRCLDCHWSQGTEALNPINCSQLDWRIKPTTITYTVTVPEPLRKIPKDGEKYWYIVADDIFVTSAGDRRELDRGLLECGNMWDSREKAKAAFEAIFAPLRKKP
jgi:hypothetical protein